ncbi:flavin reductase family protein [Rubellimicrobium aerolatum]|uniref:Flavin reductase family protein n=1 Tax=Rubellimicrobium aerolatum TaxID=490979 RepID=A0ABW0SCL5_9RHOB|nr:flavin reductase family protein [Rubellimicrobium aerolatum]MBP1806199.1 flavin reductase (DIM6/NTAB) family NADH-FMN oxidoreductase RutF [Rubellimicrobium aerolatum]
MTDVPSPEPDLSEAFKGAFRQHPAGVAILTADPGDGPVALTVSSLISVSAAPPTVAFSLSEGSTSSAPLLRAETLVIHLLRRQDRPLADLCATKGADRFGPGVRWDRLPGGEPFYMGVANWFQARILHRFPVAGATLVVAELMAGQVDRSEAGHKESLVYLDRRWHGLHPAPEPMSDPAA